MVTISVYDYINSNSREAMTFYKECFDGELTLETVKGSPNGRSLAEGSLNNILHASLTKKSTNLASDMVEHNGLQLEST